MRLPGHHRYQLTPLGRRVAVLFTKTYGRVSHQAWPTLDPRLPTELAQRSPLAIAWRQLDRDTQTNSPTRHSPRLNPKLDLIVNFAPTKRS